MRVYRQGLIKTNPRGGKNDSIANAPMEILWLQEIIKIKQTRIDLKSESEIIVLECVLLRKLPH
jgi:hypothetical protein